MFDFLIVSNNKQKRATKQKALCNMLNGFYACVCRVSCVKLLLFTIYKKPLNKASTRAK